MADISKELNDIASAVYGKDVRSAIHDSIEKLNDEKIGADKISDNAITTDKIEDGAVTAEKLAEEYVRTDEPDGIHIGEGSDTDSGIAIGIGAKTLAEAENHAVSVAPEITDGADVKAGSSGAWNGTTPLTSYRYIRISGNNALAGSLSGIYVCTEVAIGSTLLAAGEYMSSDGRIVSGSGGSDAVGKNGIAAYLDDQGNLYLGGKFTVDESANAGGAAVYGAIAASTGGGQLYIFLKDNADVTINTSIYSGIYGNYNGVYISGPGKITINVSGNSHGGIVTYSTPRAENISILRGAKISVYGKPMNEKYGITMEPNNSGRIAVGAGAVLEVNMCDPDVPISAIQIGKGVNTEEDTFNVNEFRLMDADGHIPTERIPNGSITSDKIADKTILTDNIGDYQITQMKLAQGSVPNNRIQNGAVDTRTLADNAVTSAKIADGAVTTEKLAPFAVTPSEIAGNAVSTEHLRDNAVTANKLAQSAVKTRNISNNAVTTDEIADGAVTLPKLSDDVIIAASGGVIYTETPRKVGEWTDGTPVWRCTFEVPITDEDKENGSMYIDVPVSSLSDAFVTNVFAMAGLDSPCAVDDVPCEYEGMQSIAISEHVASSPHNIMWGWYEFVTPENNLST